MRIVVYNLGCKVNQYESDAIIKQLIDMGHEVLSDLADADIYIVNTCAVTSEAEKKSRQIVSRCRKFNATSPIIVCGCASQNDHVQFVGKNGVQYVSGVAAKGGLVRLLELNGVNVVPLPTVYEDDLTATAMRTRAYVKVQDGCDNFCSYCLIPYLRGRSRSRKIDSIITECMSLSGHVKEIVLTGINLSAYGEDTGSSLTELVLSLRDIDARLRFGSLEVGVVTPQLLDATRQIKKFCPQFHLSLQSGDDSVLKSMNRHYTTNDYLDRVNLIRDFYPMAGITTDVICGYPTEHEDMAGNTRHFCSGVDFLDIHIFGYSPRSGTAAYKLKALPPAVVKLRCQELEAIRAISQSNNLQRYLGTTLEVLTEDGNCGYSREYVKVYIDGDVEPNLLVTVQPYKIVSGGVAARLVP